MPDEINVAFFQIRVWKIMVEQLYAEEPRGEFAEDSAVISRDHTAFAIFTGLEHVHELFGIHVTI